MGAMRKGLPKLLVLPWTQLAIVVICDDGAQTCYGDPLESSRGYYATPKRSKILRLCCTNDHHIVSATRLVEDINSCLIGESMALRPASVMQKLENDSCEYSRRLIDCM